VDGVSRPRLLGVVDDRSMIASEFVQGTRLRDIAEDEWARPLEQVGRIVGRLHAVARSDRPGIAAAAERRSIDDLAEDYRRLLPEAAPRLAEIVPPLRELSAGEDVLVHGDLHASQILTGPTGAILVDWDQAGWGPALRDLGSFLAHLEAIGAAPMAEPFLRGYADAAEALPDAEEIRLWTARMLFLRLGDPFRRLLPDWPERMTGILGRIETLLVRGVTAP